MRPKFMQQLPDDSFRKLTILAKKRGIVLQELLRCVIIPEWLFHQKTLMRDRRKRR